jgi:hypothetical protein
MLILFKDRQSKEKIRKSPAFPALKLGEGAQPIFKPNQLYIPLLYNSKFGLEFRERTVHKHLPTSQAIIN